MVLMTNTLKLFLDIKHILHKSGYSVFKKNSNKKAKVESRTRETNRFSSLKLETEFILLSLSTSLLGCQSPQPRPLFLQLILKLLNRTLHLFQLLKTPNQYPSTLNRKVKVNEFNRTNSLSKGLIPLLGLFILCNPLGLILRAPHFRIQSFSRIVKNSILA